MLTVRFLNQLEVFTKPAKVMDKTCDIINRKSGSMPSVSEPSKRLIGQYHDGFSAKIRPVVLELAGTNLALRDYDGHLVRHWRCEDIRLVEQIAGQGYRLALKSGEQQRLVVEHPDTVAFINDSCAFLRDGSRFSRHATRSYIFWCCLFLIITVLTALYFFSAFSF